MRTRPSYSKLSKQCTLTGLIWVSSYSSRMFVKANFWSSRIKVYISTRSTLKTSMHSGLSKACTSSVSPCASRQRFWILLIYSCWNWWRSQISWLTRNLSGCTSKFWQNRESTRKRSISSTWSLSSSKETRLRSRSKKPVCSMHLVTPSCLSMCSSTCSD